MTRLHYISPSTLPSRSANAVHVPLQCEGLVSAGAEVTLYARRGMPAAVDLPAALGEWYGIDTRGMTLVSYYSRIPRADNLRIAALAVAALRKAPRAKILSRNLYASFALGVVQRRPLIFETHQLEYGTAKRMQKAIMVQPHVTTLVISRKLIDCLEEHHGVQPARALVLHDGAAAGIQPLPWRERRPALRMRNEYASGSWDAVCGYFGHLYAGRGIELIEAMARARPRCLFLVYGGNQSDVEAKRQANALPNLYFAGHVPHRVAREVMRTMDVLLMPYQRTVAIGVRGHDTARWMSPMKMFEYMACGVPLISSDLPVLCEVLEDGVNCLLAQPDSMPAWLAALDRLIADPALGATLGARAHADYATKYTWSERGRCILEATSYL